MASYGSINNDGSNSSSNNSDVMKNRNENELTARATNLSNHPTSSSVPLPSPHVSTLFETTTATTTTTSAGPSENTPSASATSAAAANKSSSTTGATATAAEATAAGSSTTDDHDHGNDNNDDYIISLIRRDSSAFKKNRRRRRNNEDGGSGGQQQQQQQQRTTSSSGMYSAISSDDDSNSSSGHGTGDDHDDDDDDAVTLDDGLDGDEHATTYSQTIIHLVKGYIGCGILSLPWAVSQLGIPLGMLAIIVMSLWSSYNCWTVVRLKRYIERNELRFPSRNDQGGDEHGDEDDNDDDDDDDGANSSLKGGGVAGSRTGTRSLISRESTVSSRASTNVTYPDVGEWAYGLDFQSYVAACICTQQLAICTVFLSFIGENLYAVLQFLNITALQNHEAVVSCCVPAVLVLSFIPSLKQLTPVMMAGTVLIMAGFASLGMIGVLEWQNRPSSDELPILNPVKSPMALCGILYSFEGICIILPVESAMQEPRKFLSAFVISMSIVTALLCAVAGLSVVAFGEVSNGSITAFLLEEYGDVDNLKFWLMVSNLLVSISIILTYPLQLFPAVELIAPMVQKYNQRHGRKCGGLCFGGGVKSSVDDDDDDEHDLNGFEPLEEIPEHDVASLASLPSQHHDYGTLGATGDGQKDNDDGEDADAPGAAHSISRLSSMGQSVVDYINPEMQLPGDSPLLRACLVLGTYTVALVVPNVEALVSLAGAIAGSSTALLIPPILDLALIRHLEQRDEKREMQTIDSGNNNLSSIGMLMPEWEGGPSLASKSTLLKVDNVSGDVSGKSAAVLTSTAGSPRPHHYRHHAHTRKRKSNKYFHRKILSWCLLVLGIVFALFGSYFSVQDIISIYLG